MSELHHSNPALPVVKPTTTTKPTTVDDDKGYARSGRIMLGAIVVLFGVIIVMVLLHIYARWYIHRHPTSSNSTTRRRRRRRIADHHHQHHLVFYLDDPASASTAPSSDGANRRLDPSVLKSLPTFTFAPHTASTTTATTTTAGEGKEEEEEKEEEETVMECAVCLSEFEEGEMGRILPRCRHSFHVDCIDMWFHSHSTCPLCRSTVTAADNDDSNQLEIVVVDLSSSSSESIPTLNPADSPPPDATATATNDHTSSTSSSSSSTSAESASAAASGFCPDPSSTSSFGGRRKGTVGGVSVEIPARSATFSFLNPAGAVTDDSPSTPGSSLGFRSPTSRLVYLRRILLSREKRPAACSPGSGSGCGAELSEMEEGVVGGGRSPRTADICTGTTVPAPESS